MSKNYQTIREIFFHSGKEFSDFKQLGSCFDELFIDDNIVNKAQEL